MNFAALENALQSILTEVDGKADASMEPGEEREHANDYMRIQGEADTALAEVKRLSSLFSEGKNRIAELERQLAGYQPQPLMPGQRRTEGL